MCLDFDSGAQIKLGFAAEFSNVLVIYTHIVKKPEDMSFCQAHVTDFSQVRKSCDINDGCEEEEKSFSLFCPTETFLDIWFTSDNYCIKNIVNDFVWCVGELPPAGPRCGSQRDEQRDSGGNGDLSSVQQPAAALPLHPTQLPAEAQGKNASVIHAGWDFMYWNKLTNIIKWGKRQCFSIIMQDCRAHPHPHPPLC